MRAERSDAYPIPLMVLQNNRDCTVVQPAGSNLRDAQLRLNGGPDHDTVAQAKALEQDCTPIFVGGYGCRHVAYTVDALPAGRSLVETVFYDGPTATPDRGDTDHGHYWVGGRVGRDGRWALQHGPSYPDIVWNFFDRHPRQGGAVDHAPVITLSGPNPLQVRSGDPFLDPGASATDVEGGALPVQADCGPVDPARVGSHACSYRATDSASRTTTVTRTVLVTDAATCQAVVATPGAHVASGRALRGGWFGLRALSSGDRLDVGFAWDFAMRSMPLYEGAEGRWFVRRPQGCAAAQR